MLFRSKDKLCQQFNLNPKKPLFAFIGRLVKEKGADILPDVIYHTMTNYTNEQNVLILGSGESVVENSLLELEKQFKGNFCSYIGITKNCRMKFMPEPIFC